MYVCTCMCMCVYMYIIYIHTHAHVYADEKKMNTSHTRMLVYATVLTHDNTRQRER
jgi:hypothetical protein